MKKNKIQCKAFVSDSGQLLIPRPVLQGVGFQFSGREVFVTIEDVLDMRTPNQNAYYYAAIVYPITKRFNDLGERFDNGKVHEILKYMFLKVSVPNLQTAEVAYEYVRSTADLTIPEFSFYIEDCIRYAAENLDLVIEPPRARRPDYLFPIFSSPKESREKYITRIEKMLQDIHSIENLRRFFRQNPEWKEDAEIVSLFSSRKAQVGKT